MVVNVDSNVGGKMNEKGSKMGKTALMVILMAAMAPFASGQSEWTFSSPSSSTQDDTEQLVIPPALPPQNMDDVIITDTSLSIGDQNRLKSQYNADLVFNELTENTQYCVSDCHAEFLLDNKEEIPIESLHVEFYHDDHTFIEPSDNIVSYRILIWNGESWTST